jgi:hypothetical protein
MTTIPFVTSDWRRETAQEPALKVENRYFEQNPSNQVEGSSLILRPGLRYWTTVPSPGDQVHGLYTNQGIFQNKLFVLSDAGVHAFNDLGFYDVVDDVPGVSPVLNNQACFTAPIEDIPGYFYYLKTGALYVTAETTFAENTLVKTGTIEADAVVVIGGTYYKFVDYDVNTGSPAGTLADPWLVSRTTGTAYTNFFYAVNANTTASIFAGTHYSSGVTRNPLVTALDFFGNDMYFVANDGGSLGNGIAVSTSATVVLAWNNTTFTGGGDAGTGYDNSTHPVFLPRSGGSSIRCLDVISSYVVLAINDSFGSQFSGKFMWILPGETIIDDLNFATTEMSPDTIISIRVVGERIWFIGAETTEIWYLTGDADNPFARVQGQSFSGGGLEGSDQKIGDQLMFVGRDYKCRLFAGSSSKVVSTPAIEEAIRKYTQYRYQASGSKLYSYVLNSDGHVFYCLNIPDTGVPDSEVMTLVYDLTTDQWTHWHVDGEDTFRGSCASPWMTQTSNTYDTQYLPIIGDYDSGTLWKCDPEYSYDELVEDEITLIPTTVSAGVPMRLRDRLRCNELYLTASLGDPAVPSFFLVDTDGSYLTDTDGSYLLDFSVITSDVDDPSVVTLSYSDDNGKTWSAPRGVHIIFEDYSQELVWRSLGSIGAPGRLFRISDYGGLKRLDGLDMR